MGEDKNRFCAMGNFSIPSSDCFQDDPEATLSEEDFRKRKAHPNFKEHLNVEKTVIKNGKKGPLKSYVVASGLVYHGGESIFHFFLKVKEKILEKL